VTAGEIAHALGGRKCGPGRWVARCPVHEDRTPSLSIAQKGETVLIHCFVCDQQILIERLRAMGLWQHEHHELTPAERKVWARAKREAEAARLWGRAVWLLAETVLEDLPLATAERAVHTRLLRIIRTGGPDLVTEYRRWLKAIPKLAKAMREAGRASEARLETGLRVLTADWGSDAA
jgi:hypothetical protein